MPLTLGTLSGEGERTPFTLTRTDGFSSAVSGSSATVSTASARSIGTAASDRVLIIAVGGGTSNFVPTEITAMTVGGVSATRIVSIGGDNGTSSYSAAFFVLPYPNDTTAIMSFTYATGITDRYLSVATYAGYGLQSTTPVATDSTLYTAGTLTRTIRARSGGNIIGFSMGFLSLGTRTWTNLSNAFSTAYSAAAFSGFSRGQSVNVGYTTSNGADSALVLASFA